MRQLGDSGGARVCRVTERRLLAEKLREVDPERTRNCLLARGLTAAAAAPPGVESAQVRHEGMLRFEPVR